MTNNAFYMDARNEGRKEGREEGRLIMLAQLVDDGTLSLRDAASRSGMSESAFKKAVEELSLNSN